MEMLPDPSVRVIARLDAELVGTVTVRPQELPALGMRLAGGGTDATSNRALAQLRNEALPATLGRVSGIDYAVTGMTAGTHDFDARLGAAMPLVLPVIGTG